MRNGKILIACEKTQIVCKAFRLLNHEAYSCDLQECSGGHPEWHLQIDALKALKMKKWDLVIAHPPCTRLANSGVRWLRERNLWDELKQASEFFYNFVNYGLLGFKLAIENPIPHKYAKLPDYTQIIQPWQFGHPETKATCLWLYGLPPLIPTNIIDGREQRIWKMPPGKNRSELRSETYSGIALAMAAQWFQLLK